MFNLRSMFLGAERRRGYGPFILCLFAFPLVLTLPIMNVLKSLNYVQSFAPLSTLVNVISWIGVIQMTTASSWNASLDEKLRDWIRMKFQVIEMTGGDDDCGSWQA